MLFNKVFKYPSRERFEESENDEKLETSHGMKIIDIEIDSINQEEPNFKSSEQMCGEFELKRKEETLIHTSLGENTLESHFRGSSFGKYSGLLFNSIATGTHQIQRSPDLREASFEEEGIAKIQKIKFGDTCIQEIIMTDGSQEVAGFLKSSMDNFDDTIQSQDSNEKTLKSSFKASDTNAS